MVLSDPARGLTLDYGDQVDSVHGRRWFPSLAVTGSNGVLLQTNAVLPGTDTEAPNGLRSIPVGETWPSRMKLGFNVTSPDGTDLVWGDRFTPTDFPGSTHVKVTRTTETEWIVEATTSDIAYVRSTADRRHGGEVFEGLYHLPFRMKVTAAQ